MSGNNFVLLDSNIIIYISKGELDISDVFGKYKKVYISIITYMEILGFKFNNSNEEKLIKKLLNYLDIIEIDITIADETINIRKNNKIKLPDAIILATAKLYKCDLLTRNVQDFEKSGYNFIYNPIK